MKNKRVLTGSAMIKRRVISNRRRVYLARESRSGVIFASEDIAEEKRARLSNIAHVIRTAKTYLGSVARVPDDHAITNILADLRHYCDSKGLVFGKLTSAAHALYLEQKADGVG